MWTIRREDLKYTKKQLEIGLKYQEIWLDQYNFGKVPWKGTEADIWYKLYVQAKTPTELKAKELTDKFFKELVKEKK